MSRWLSALTICTCSKTLLPRQPPSQKDLNKTKVDYCLSIFLCTKVPAALQSQITNIKVWHHSVWHNGAQLIWRHLVVILTYPRCHNTHWPMGDTTTTICVETRKWAAIPMNASVARLQVWTKLKWDNTWAWVKIFSCHDNISTRSVNGDWVQNAWKRIVSWKNVTKIWNHSK